ncbi:MAG: thioredoxin domain-containing protein [Patescibacteria group bacterium]
MDTDKTAGGTIIEKYLTPIAVVVGALIIAGAFAFGNSGTTANPQQGQQAVKVNIKDVKTEGSPFIGDANAPVTIAIWFDYQCPYCKKFEETVTNKLIENYVKTGKLKIVFKDFQFLGEDSMVDAEFARAMWEAYPDHYYEWYMAMFAAQDDEGDKGFGDLESVKTLTAKIPGVDVAKVVKLMTDKKSEYDTAITADRTEGQALGIKGTPNVIIGTSLLSGAQPYESVAPLIDAQLKK